MPLKRRAMSDDKADWILVEQVKAGDARAFDELMERYERPILSFVYRMIGDASEAEDMAQDVFVRAYRNIRNHRRSPVFAEVGGSAPVSCKAVFA